MMDGIEINKENINVAVKAILWYGTGCHSRCTDLNLEMLEKVFEVESNQERQAFYNCLESENIEINHEYSYLKCEPIKEAPIKECCGFYALAVRAILYSYKYEQLYYEDDSDDIDDACIGVATFIQDMRCMIN